MDGDKLDEIESPERKRVVGETVTRGELPVNPVIVSFSSKDKFKKKGVIKRFYDDMIAYNRDR